MAGDYTIHDTSRLLSPSLVVFREIVKRNLDTMVAMAGSPDRLRPHVKTHKMPAVVRLVESMGIQRHKCATIAEAEMIAQSGGRDVLIAYPLVGPNVARLIALIETYPATTFHATVESETAARALSEASSSEPHRKPISVLIDLDVGMGRTGIEVEAAEVLYHRITELPGLEPGGLHAYDGQIRDANRADRVRTATPGVEAVLRLRDRLLASGLAVPRLVLGGTPSFPIHASLDEPNVECSAGTAPFFDAGYAGKFPDLPFTPAALVLTRVISGPKGNRITLDLGHKAIAADPAGDRMRFVDLPGAKLGPQSEEHLVVETLDAARYPEGTALLAIPTHICPTCALHAFAYVVEDGEVVDRWEVAARDRVIGV
jgi:D-serine deaminase-like pyridoxal phosphate-dependent protein